MQLKKNPTVKRPASRSRAWRVLSLVFSSLCAVVASGEAQERGDERRSDSVQTVGTVTVQAKRAPLVVGGASAVVTSIDSLTLPAAPVLDQALRELPFILVRRNSRGEMELGMRGSDSRQVAVLVDGVPLTLGWDHRTDPSIIPLTGARSITLVRGLSSVLHGPNVLGGVIEVGLTDGTAPADRAPALSLSGSFDHLGSRTIALAGGLPIGSAGRWTARAGFGMRDRPGFALGRGIADIGTDDPDLRSNSDLSHVDGFASLRYATPGGAHVGASLSAYNAERGVPPELHVEEPRLWRYPEQKRTLAIVNASTGRRDTPFGRGELQASIGFNDGHTEIESFASAAYDEIAGMETGDDRTITARVVGEHSLGARGSIRTAATMADVNYDERVDADPLQSYEQRLWSVGSEVTLPVATLTQVTGGIVFDAADTPESGDKPPLGTISAWGGRVGVSTIAAGGELRLHAAVSQRSRFPALRELYSGALGRFEPNPDLRPERLRGFEGGVTTNQGGVDLQAVLFHHRLSGAIVRAPAGDGMLRRENRDQIRSTGVELLAGWAGDAIAVTADLTAQHIRLHGPAAGESRRPEHQPEFRMGTELSFPLPLTITGQAAARYTGSQMCVHPDLEREVELDPQLSADAGVARSWTLRGAARSLLRTLRLSLTLENVADAAVYDQCGLPQPGRTLRLGFEVR
ncbi:MAG TPA: TonB-dependent receptor [Gemmatimonadaceae bacterium]|nr:TonB-dependent receptor [Gemmatimonadaceae bacterium]